MTIGNELDLFIANTAAKLDDLSARLEQLEAVPDTIPEPLPGLVITKRNGISIYSVADLRAWHSDNCKPNIPLTQYVGNVVLTSQASADAIRGKAVLGSVTVRASNLVIEDFAIEWDGNDNTRSLLDFDGSASGCTVRRFDINGKKAKTVIGIGGASYSAGHLFEFGTIRNYGFDAIRLFKNSTYRRLFVHSPFEWDSASMGPYNSGESQLIYPHTDVAQAIRSGAVMQECWLENGSADNATSCIMCKSDTNEQIDGFELSDSYLNGGHYTVSVHNKNGTKTNPGEYGHPINVRILRNIFGRGYRVGVLSHSVPDSSIAFSGNRWADTLELVPTSDGPL